MEKIKAGRPLLGEHKRVKLVAWVDPAVKNGLALIAIQMGISRSEVVHQVIKSALQNKLKNVTLIEEISRD